MSNRNYSNMYNRNSSNMYSRNNSNMHSRNDSNMYNRSNTNMYNNDSCGCDEQQHVHEVIGSTEPVGECNACHNHRFCTMSGEAIAVSGNDHVHEVTFRTDHSDGHYHEFCGKSSGAIAVGNGKHVHYACASTETEDGHVHRFQVASLINSPTDFK